MLFLYLISVVCEVWCFLVIMCVFGFVFFFKQKTAYEMCISDWSSDVCDLYAERDQAKALREQARAGGLRFEAYLTGDQADWLLERIERGMFADPSEAV